jgi:hypothetical protein
MTITERISGRRPRGAPRAEDLLAPRDWVYRRFGVRVRPARLDADDQRQLVDLVRRAAALEKEPRRTDVKPLDVGDRRRLDRLIEASAGLESGELQRRRDEAATETKMRDLAARARRPRRRPALAEEGSVTLCRQFVFEYVVSGVLLAEHVAMLVVLASMFENSEPLAPGFTFSDDGVLTLDTALGFFGGRLDPDGALAGWKRTLAHLEANAFVQVERRGRTWTIRPGSRWLKARERSQ